MAQVACDSGLSRENLYKAPSGERSPDFDTILKVMGALGLRLQSGASTLGWDEIEEEVAARRGGWREVR